jgi:hypothetical protein
MTGIMKVIKITSVFVIFALMCPLPAKPDTPFVNTKLLGKLTMVAILSVNAFIVKKLVDRDINKTISIHKNLGLPDRVVEYQEGFDHWRIEWYGDYIYTFRNGVFSYKRVMSDGK